MNDRKSPRNHDADTTTVSPRSPPHHGNDSGFEVKESMQVRTKQMQIKKRGSSTPTSPNRSDSKTLAEQHPSRLLQPKIHTPRKSPSSTSSSPTTTPIKKTSPNRSTVPKADSVTVETMEGKAAVETSPAETKSSKPTSMDRLNGVATKKAPSKTTVATLQQPLLDSKTKPPEKKTLQKKSTREFPREKRNGPNTTNHVSKLKSKGNAVETQGRIKTPTRKAKEKTSPLTARKIVEQHLSTSPNNSSSHPTGLDCRLVVDTSSSSKSSSPPDVEIPSPSNSSVSTATHMSHFQQEFKIDHEESLLSEDSDLDEADDDEPMSTSKKDGPRSFDWNNLDTANDEDIESTSTTKEEDLSVDTEAANSTDRAHVQVVLSKNSDESKTRKEGKQTRPSEPRDDLLDDDKIKSPSPWVDHPIPDHDAGDSFGKQTVDSEDEVPCSTSTLVDMDEVVHDDISDGNYEFVPLKDEWYPAHVGVRDLHKMAEEATAHTRNISKKVGPKKNGGKGNALLDHETTERTDEDHSGVSTDIDDPRASMKKNVTQVESQKSLWCCCFIS